MELQNEFRKRKRQRLRALEGGSVVNFVLSYCGLHF